MKKKDFIFGVALLTLVGCSNNSDVKKEKTPQSIEVAETKESTQEPTSHRLSFGESYTFNKKDFETTGYDNVGLKMSVVSAVIDDGILNSIKEYTHEDELEKLEGKRPLVLTIQYENTTDNYIDLGGITVLDNEGKTLEYNYATGYSTEPIDGLTSKQKITATDVYLVSNDNPVTVTYNTVTWENTK